jgi:hypothetical protein
MKAIASLAILILSPIWRGFVLSKLWLWFVVSTFGLPVLGLAQAIGISLIVSYLTLATPSKKPDDAPKYSLVECVAISIVIPAFALLMGWIVQFFLP